MDFIYAVEAAKSGAEIRRDVAWSWNTAFTIRFDDSKGDGLDFYVTSSAPRLAYTIKIEDVLANDWIAKFQMTDFKHALDALFSGKRIGRIAWLSEPPDNVAYGYKTGKSGFEVYSDTCDDSRDDVLYNMALSSADITADDWVAYDENWKVVTI